MHRREIALEFFRRHEAETKARAKRDIEAYRKGNAVLRFVDKKGEPLSGVTVSFAQKNHAFRHGANLFMLDEFPEKAQNDTYKALFPTAFNLATLPFYWRDQEPEQGQTRYAADSPKLYRRPPADLCLAYCQEQGIEPKAHCLNYDFFLPHWLKGCSIEEHKTALEKRFAELSQRYADQIPSWEVTNETFNVPFARSFLDPHYSLFYREADFVPWSFRMAKRYFPHNRLIINDHTDFGCMRSLDGDYFGARSPYYMQIERLLEDPEVKLDSIGFQYHCFIRPEDEERIAKTRYNPIHLYDVLDTYAKLGCRLQMTEMTVSALGDSKEDEDVQAELIRCLYTIFFSHPSMEAIIYWNLPDGYAAGGALGDMEQGENRFHGGLCRFDLSEKPAFGVIRDLFSKEWHTEGHTCDKEGEACFRGFLGDYELTLTYRGKEIKRALSLTDTKDNLFTVTLE